ncbi:MAG: SRPBCC family protein [Gemmatimonadota bacterium]
MKKIALAVAITAVVLVAGVFGGGMLLPVAHVASVRAEYAADTEEVFALIADYRSQPDWRPSVDRIEVLAPRNGEAAWQEIGPTGSLPMELTESDPPRRMVTTILSDGMPFGGRWIYEVEPAPGGATLTITEEGEIYNPAFRFISRFIIGHHRTATTYLRDLGRVLGNDVTVEVVR